VILVQDQYLSTLLRGRGWQRVVPESILTSSTSFGCEKRKSCCCSGRLVELVFVGVFGGVVALEGELWSAYFSHQHRTGQISIFSEILELRAVVQANADENAAYPDEAAVQVELVDLSCLACLAF